MLSKSSLYGVESAEGLGLAAGVAEMAAADGLERDGDGDERSCGRPGGRRSLAASRAVVTGLVGGGVFDLLFANAKDVGLGGWFVGP